MLIIIITMSSVVQVKLLRNRFSNVNIQVDGGVGPDNIQTCAEV